MKTITDSDIVAMLREEWDRRVRSLSETVDVTLNAKVGKGEEQTVISPELKIIHKKSGIRYTIDSVGPRDCILRTPEGEKILVGKEEIESAYELD
jgi:hypothetical protein